MVHEAEHDLLKFLLTHLTVADADSRSRTDSTNEIGVRVDGFHAIVNEIHLPPSIQFEINRVLDDLRVELDH